MHAAVARISGVGVIVLATNTTVRADFAALAGGGRIESEIKVLGEGRQAVLRYGCESYGF